MGHSHVSFSPDVKGGHERRSCGGFLCRRGSSTTPEPSAQTKNLLTIFPRRFEFQPAARQDCRGHLYQGLPVNAIQCTRRPPAFKDEGERYVTRSFVSSPCLPESGCLQVGSRPRAKRLARHHTSPFSARDTTHLNESSSLPPSSSNSPSNFRHMSSIVFRKTSPLGPSGSFFLSPFPP